jgi:hypothetical protein
MQKNKAKRKKYRLLTRQEKSKKMSLFIKPYSKRYKKVLENLPIFKHC